jgi:hypothetical protein
VAPPIAKRQRLAISNLLEWLSATTKVISRDKDYQPRQMPSKAISHDSSDFGMRQNLDG